MKSSNIISLIILFFIFAGCRSTPPANPVPTASQPSNKVTGLLAPEQFARKYADAFSKDVPGVKIEPVSVLELKITPPDGNTFTVFLNNAYDTYKKDPSAINDVIQRYVISTSDTIKTKSHVIEKTRIVPVIKDRQWLAETRQAMLSRGFKDIPEYFSEDYNDELMIFYAEDSPTNIRYVSQKDLDKAGIELKDLRKIACENLKNILTNIERRGENGLYMITAGGNYEASLLLLDFVWKKGQMEVQGDIVVAIPTRDLLLVTGSKNPEGIDRIKKIVANTFKDNPPYRLTPKLFIYRNGKFEVFEKSGTSADIQTTLPSN